MTEATHHYIRSKPGEVLSVLLLAQLQTIAAPS